MNLEIKNTEEYCNQTENRNIVYICSPLRDDIDRNQRKACGYCRFVASEGYIPVAVHLLFPQFLDDYDEMERNRAMRMSLELLSRCDELWCFGEKITDSMLIELEFAKKYHIDIRYFTDTCEEISRNEVAHE